MNQESKLGPVIVSGVVAAGFVMVLTLWLLRPPSIADNNSFQVLSVLVGTLSSAFTLVVGYWIGSSSGSKSKDATIQGLSKN